MDLEFEHAVVVRTLAVDVSVFVDCDIRRDGNLLPVQLTNDTG
jgi:hypothetical protein